MPQALNYSYQIVKENDSTFQEKIEYLELLRQDKSKDYSSWLASVEKDARASADHAAEFARWKVLTTGPTNALLWMAELPAQIQTNMPLPLVRTDCQIAIKDWSGVLKEVQSQDWSEANFYRLALQSLAERSLSQNTAAEASWNKAFRASAHRLDKLSRLAQVTKTWGWQSEYSELLADIVAEFPQETWAVDQLAAKLYDQGKTSEMESLYFRIYTEDPSNIKVKNNLANLYLLRKIELGKAYEMAKEVYNTSTNNPFFVSTYAYSLLLQDKKGEALNVFNNVKPEHLQIPSVSLYYGIVQAESGSKEIAREALKRAEASKLLPEEKAIAQLAESRM
jgi:predicted Zn-dependent protease